MVINFCSHYMLTHEAKLSSPTNKKGRKAQKDRGGKAEIKVSNWIISFEFVPVNKFKSVATADEPVEKEVPPMHFEPNKGNN
jgi:hypothetical protein